MKIYVKRLISINIIFLLVILILNTSQISLAVEDSPVDVIIRGKHINMKVDPILKNNKTYIPIREFGESLDFKGEWLKNQNTAKLSKLNTTILIPIGQREIYLNDEKINIGEKSFVKEGRTFIPLRSVSEVLSQKVEWDQKNKIVIVGDFISKEYLEYTFVYTNEEHGYTLNFPNSWKDEAVLETKSGNLCIYDRASYEKFKEQGIDNFGPVLEIKVGESPIFTTVPYEDILLKYKDGKYIETSFGRDFQYFPDTVESYEKIYEEAKKSLGSFKVLDKKYGLKTMFYEYGFSIAFPVTWNEQFEIFKDKNTLVISSKVNEIESLASIPKYTTEEWKKLNYGLDIPTSFDVLGKTSESVFALIYASDVSYNLENENSVKKHKEMSYDLMNKNFKFEILDDEDYLVKGDKENYKIEVETLNSILDKYVPRGIFDKNEILVYSNLIRDTSLLYLRHLKSGNEVEIKIEADFNDVGELMRYRFKNYSFDLKENNISQEDALNLANTFVNSYGDKDIKLMKIPNLYPSLYEENKHETYGDEESNYIIAVDLEYGIIEYFNKNR